jgi:hypothetical protein
MTAPDGMIPDLLVGLAQLLDARGVGAYRPGVAQAADAVAIVLSDSPPEPDRVIVLTAYPLTDDPTLNDLVLGVTVRCRGRPDAVLGADELADQVRRVLHGLQHTQFGATAYVSLLSRFSSAPLGMDANRRRERVENYRAMAADLRDPE